MVRVTRLGVGLLVLGAIVLAGCSEGSKSGTGPPPVTYSIAITAPDSTLMVGQTSQLAATLTQLGLAVELIAPSGPWDKFAGDQTARFLTRFLESRHISVHTGRRPQRFPLRPNFLKDRP